MSYRFELERERNADCDFICTAMCQRSITIMRSLADACAAKYHRESSSSEILRASVEPWQECNQPVWQIVYMPCANPILRSTIPVDGSASATPRDATQYARSQAWRRLNSAGSASFWRLSQATLVALGWRKGDVYRSSREGGMRYPREDGDRVAS